MLSVEEGRGSKIPFSVIPTSPALYVISLMSFFLAHMAKFFMAVLFMSLS